MSTYRKPFKIAVDEVKFKRLKEKLSLTNLPDEIEGDDDDWGRGTPLKEIRRLSAYWKNDYDWPGAVAKLNQFQQEIVEVNVDDYGSNLIHCIHERSAVENAIPLLFVHGWPGSFIEVTKLLPILLNGTDDAPAFHVVAPSLLNFGFSSGVTKPGFNTAKHAEALNKLMETLGYSQYVVQGGDIGYSVARFLARMYPESCKAHHINMVAAEQPTEDEHPDLVSLIRDTELTSAEKRGLDRAKEFAEHGMAYAMMHATKPQTLSYSMCDSPVGLLAWILEKLHAWTDSYPWTDDEILTWVSIYWFSEAGPHASQRYYREALYRLPTDFRLAARFIDTKLGISRFPREIVQTPRLWARSLGRVVLDKEHDRGGHFAAWECPEELAGDLREMFSRHGGAAGVIDGCDGYKV